MARKGTKPLPEFVAAPDATPPAQGDLLEQLAFDHRQIERLWSQLELAHRRQLDGEHRPGARHGGGGQPDLARQMVTALAEHDAREVEVLYPAVSRIVGEETAEHSLADHEEIRLLLDRVDGANPADEQVFQTFRSLMGKVVAHNAEEESIAFPMLRAALSDRQLADLGQPPAAVEARASGGAPEADVIDLAAAERRQAEGVEPTKVGLADRGRRLLRRR